MPIDVTCACGETYGVSRKLAGKRVKCKTCGGAMVVPDLPSSAVTNGSVEGPPSDPPPPPASAPAAPEVLQQVESLGIRFQEAELHFYNFDRRLVTLERRLLWVSVGAGVAAFVGLVGVVLALAAGS